jgi:hypothetical protein
MLWKEEFDLNNKLVLGRCSTQKITDNTNNQITINTKIKHSEENCTGKQNLLHS